MAKSSKTGFGISPQDDAALEHIEQPTAPVAARPRADQRPVCPAHRGQMVCYHSSAMYSYYKCPEKGCQKRARTIRPIGPLKNLYGHGKSAGRALLNPDPEPKV